MFKKSLCFIPINYSKTAFVCRGFSNFSSCGLQKTDKWKNDDIIHNINESKKLLKVAIIGTPNAGKSTLINQLVDRRVVAISKKVHTTRCRATAVLIENHHQIIFLDTPGVVSVEESVKYRLESEFLADGEEAIAEADVIGVIHDVSNPYYRNKINPKVLRLLHLNYQKESFLVLNKIDTVKSKRDLLELSVKLTGGKLRKYNEKTVKWAPLSEKSLKDLIKKDDTWNHFSDIFMVSALLGEGTNQLKTYLLNAAHPGEWIFEAHEFTDQSEQKIIEDTVKSKLLEYLPNEVPYKLNVQLEYLDFDESEVKHIVVLVGCQNAKMKKFILQGGGSKIRLIASEAEKALSDTFFSNIHLKLVVCDNLPVSKKKDINNL